MVIRVAQAKSIVFGAGCFWCTQAVFEMFAGVVKTTPGYAGGTTKNPTYEQVCSGDTGYAEVISVEYDPSAISLDKLLDVFFYMHNPTSLNKQDNDVGTQYRSMILYTSESDLKIIEQHINRIKDSYKKPIVTEVKPLKKFYPAEERHMHYYQRNPLTPYCLFVTRPKISRIKKRFGIH